MDLVKQKLFGKQKRRSTEDLQPNLNDRKCFLIQEAEIFLLKILTVYKDKLNHLKKVKSAKIEQIKISEEDTVNLKQNISIQITAVKNNKTEKLLNEELDTIFGSKLQNEKEVSVNYNWNSTIVEILLHLESFILDLQSSDRINLLDCIEFYTDLLISTTSLEEDITSINIKNKTEL